MGGETEIRESAFNCEISFGRALSIAPPIRNTEANYTKPLDYPKTIRTDCWSAFFVTVVSDMF